MSRRPFFPLRNQAPNGWVPSPRILRDLDQWSSEIINAGDGGTWNPTSPIVLGRGNVFPLMNITTVGTTFTGDVETVRGNSRGDFSGIQLIGGSVPSWPWFESARLHDYFVPFNQWTEARVIGDEGPMQFGLDPNYATIKRIHTDSDHLFLVVLPPQAFIFGGAVSQVTFYYRVVQRTALPTTLPKFRVVRKVGTGVTEPCHDNSGGYDASGFLEDTAASASAYYNFGQVREVAYECNQNADDIDSDEMFAVEIYDDDDPDVFGNIFIGCRVTWSGSRLFLE